MVSFTWCHILIDGHGVFYFPAPHSSFILYTSYSRQPEQKKLLLEEVSFHINCIGERLGKTSEVTHCLLFPKAQIPTVRSNYGLQIHLSHFQSCYLNSLSYEVAHWKNEGC